MATKTSRCHYRRKKRGKKRKKIYRMSAKNYLFVRISCKKYINGHSIEEYIIVSLSILSKSMLPETSLNRRSDYMVS